MQFISAKNARVSIEKVLLELVGGRRNLKTEVSLWRRTKRFSSTLRQGNFKTEVSLWKCTKCFSSKLRRRNLKMQQSSVILDLCLRKTRAGIERFSYDLEMCTCEQNANNRLNEQKSSRLITQTRAGFDWSCKHAMFSSELKVIF